MTSDILLEVEGLGIEITSANRRAPARPIVDDIDLSVSRGEVVGIVGESGSGKSMTLKALLRLLPTGARARGDIRFDGNPVLSMSESALREYRSHGVSLIHQDPRAAINPVRTVGDFLLEGSRASDAVGRELQRSKAAALLDDVGIADAGRCMDQYPHELSGGMLQRVMIVMALMSDPQLILADEPTTALDVTVQSEVMAILMEQVRARGVGLVFVTHDLDLVAAVADSISVMYAGGIVERGAARSTSTRPRHPYTAGLLASRPRLDRVERPTAIPGRPVAAFEAEPGCAFAPRCAYATDTCRTSRPALRQVDERMVACHYAEALSFAETAEAPA